MNEGRIEELRIKIPEGFTTLRFYMYSFLNLVEAEKHEIGQYIVIRSKDLLRALIDGFGIVREIVERQRNDQTLSRLKLDTLPMSGNDRKVFMKLCYELGCELDLVQIFGAYSDILGSKSIDNLRKGLEKFDIVAEGYSLPSIFKLELYGLTRTTLFKDGFSIDPRVSPDFLLLMLAGYILSRVGRARIDERNWVSVHVFPTELAWSKSCWQRLHEELSGLWRGVRPTDALTLFLLAKLWNLLKDEPHNLLVLGVADPSGRKPAAIDMSINAPLKDIYIRAKDKLNLLFEQEWKKDIFIRLIEKALDARQQNREIAEKFVKLLFLSLQGDTRALEELLLLSSRLEVAISQIRQKEPPGREILSIARDARIIAKDLLMLISQNHFS
ncbi:MAG: hypothetical protein QW794_03065 [Thermosphaera sp.]